MSIPTQLLLAIILCLWVIVPNPVLAETHNNNTADISESSSIIPVEQVENTFQKTITWATKHFSSIRDALSKTLFFAIPLPFSEAEIPFLVLWLIFGGIFFTIRLKFINLRLFFHAFAVIRGKHTTKDEKGEVTHAQAFFTAVSATVGLGNIAGVAIAVTKGGPGAIFWMILAGFLGMSTKFAEVTLGLKYRKFDKEGRVSGGAFHYLKDGLSEMGLSQFGKILAVLFAIFCLFGALGAGNMFQSNQAVAQLTNGELLDSPVIPALVMAVMVGLVLIGGITRISKVAEAIVPLMAFIYITASLVIIVKHSDLIASAFSLILESAFSLEAAGGGLIGALIVGFSRSAFSNEAGLGSAPIAHAAAKTDEPVKEGCVALLEPFLDTIIICTLTGLVISITGVYEDAPSDVKGVLLTSRSYGSVIDWFPHILTLAVTLFAFSTMLSWSYYGERSWTYLFGNKSVVLYYILFCSMTFVGGIVNLEVINDISTYLLLAMALPNLLGLYLLTPVLTKEVNNYLAKKNIL